MSDRQITVHLPNGELRKALVLDLPEDTGPLATVDVKVVQDKYGRDAVANVEISFYERS